MSGGTPHYDLEEVQRLVGQGAISCVITSAALAGAMNAFLPAHEIVTAVLALSSADFYKSMESEQMPGFWQDVYHLLFRGIELYVKVQINADGRAVVIQFKER